MRSIMIAVVVLMFGATTFADEPRQNVIRTLRGDMRGFATVGHHGEITEYIPAWQPNAAQKSAQYDAFTDCLRAQAEYYRAKAMSISPPPEPVNPGSGPGFNTIPGSWITDKQWIKEGPVWVGPLNW